MSRNSPLEFSQSFLALFATKIFRYYEDRIPRYSSLLIVSNHRSFMDALVLMSAIDRPIRFACHRYMGQVPVMREIITEQLGCFPLGEGNNRQQSFFDRAQSLLQSQQVVGVFPEGTEPMVKFTKPSYLGEFQRGFAHLALRANVADLAVLPVAIASLEEINTATFPVRLLSLFDPSEPLFQKPGLHPMIIYRRVVVLIGRPLWITPQAKKQYQGKQAKNLVTELSQQCHSEIANLLRQGCY
jgi:1-acyl-sn-glycerol-3-phosphate acyltransferase